MKKLLYVKDSEEFWKILNEEKEKRRQKLAKLPFARKIEILEKMQADAKVMHESTKESRPRLSRIKMRHETR